MEVDRIGSVGGARVSGRFGDRPLSEHSSRLREEKRFSKCFEIVRTGEQVGRCQRKRNEDAMLKTMREFVRTLLPSTTFALTVHTHVLATQNTS